MSQEFFINSQELEDKIRQLLPSQGGAGASFDLSASNQIIPIIDLTESAQGSNLRQDLQSSLSFGSASTYSINNTTTGIITNTGYFRITCGIRINGAGTAKLQVTDGVSVKNLIVYEGFSGALQILPLDIIVFNDAGNTINFASGTVSVNIIGSSRQIADINGDLVNP